MRRITFAALMMIPTLAFARGAESFTFTVPLGARVAKPEPESTPPRRSDVDVTKWVPTQRPDEWSPWSFQVGDVLVFAWREFPNGTTHQPGFDVLRGVDTKTGRELWKRGSGGYADEMLLLNDALLLVHANDELWLLDPRTGVQRWSVRVGYDLALHAFGTVVLVRTKDQLRRIDPVGGATMWSVKARSSEGLTLIGGSLYLVAFRDLPRLSDAGIFNRPTEASLLEIDVRTGSIKDRRPLQTYDRFHDVRRAKLQPTDHGELQVDLGYIILE